MNQVIIDVREKDEFTAEHIEHSIHVPLSDFPRQAPALFKTLQGKSVVLMCRSGKRAALAASQATSFSQGIDLQVFEGGILEWKKQGNPTVATKKSHLPIMRQVQLIAGILVLTGVLLSRFVNPAFIFLSGFVGAGLTIAGATGFCGMAELLAHMPWNKTNPNALKEACKASSDGCSN